MSAAPTDAQSVLPIALRDLIRLHAPQATLLAAIGQRILNIQAEGTPTEEAQLVPPDDWLERGDLAWITRDGALLGLLWSEGAPVPEGAVQVLTLLLSAASAEGANREADMLITQLPAATAWLSAELEFRQVSRTFLELFGLSGPEVLGRTVHEVFADHPTLAQHLASAAAGRAAELGDERLPPVPGVRGERWVRGSARPYFGGAAAGVLWTVQDVSAECAQQSQVATLLGTDLPLALLGPGGTVRGASRGLRQLLGEPEDGADAAAQRPLHEWPCWAPAGARLLQDLIQNAEAGQPSPAPSEVALARGGHLALVVRPSDTEPGLLLAEGARPATLSEENGAARLLHLSGAATILLDSRGRVQLISEQAARLLGFDSQGAQGTELTGLPLPRLQQQLGIKLHTPQGDPLTLPSLPDLPLPYSGEVLALLPGGLTRHLEVTLSALPGAHAGAGSSRKAAPELLLSLRDVTTLRRAQAKLRHDVSHDALTGLLNRSGLRSALGKVAAQAGGMVACLDIDGFGGLNAALSRTAGDLLLIQVAARLNDLATLEGGQAARLADDTFAVFLPHLGAAVGGQKLQAALREPLRTGKRLVPVTFSLGAAPLSPAAPEHALADAEVALQHARRRGRGQLTVFEPGMRAEEAQTFELEDQLRAVIEGGRQHEQFSLLYQPAVSLKDGRVLGAEALLRWTHPELGNVSPARFLPLAQRSDLITAIGEWVVREAVQGRAQLREATEQHDWRTSVNLSLEELRREGAIERLLPLITRPSALDIEVSASSLLDHSEQTLGLLNALRSRGARLIVDDFGDGASSLTALTQFPLYGLKLHPTLTTQLPGDPKSLKLVQGTVSLAHSLGLSVTAVGVETYAQLDVLRDLGCDAAQGYALTPPLSVGDLVTWVRGR